MQTPNVNRVRLHTSVVSAAVAAALLVAGCASMDDTQRRTATGAGIGAIAGAVIGNVTGAGSRTGAVVGAAAGAAGGYIWSKRMEEQKRAMEQASAGTGVTVTQTEDNQLRVEVPSDVSFDVGKADIKPNFRPVLDRFAETLHQHQSTNVRIIGHTDSTGSDAINDPLSLRRATGTRDYLVDRGVAIARVSVEGRGSRQPIASNETAEGRAQNRRVEIFIAEPAPQ